MTGLLSIVVGIILLVVLLKLALGLIAFVVALAAAVFVYFLAERLIGPGR